MLHINNGLRPEITLDMVVPGREPRFGRSSWGLGRSLLCGLAGHAGCIGFAGFVPFLDVRESRVVTESVLGSLEQRLLLVLCLSGSLNIAVAASAKRHDCRQIVVAELRLLLVVMFHVLEFSRQLGVVVSLHVSSASSTGGVDLLADVGGAFTGVELNDSGLLEGLDRGNVTGSSSTCGSVYFVRRHFCGGVRCVRCVCDECVGGWCW